MLSKSGNRDISFKSSQSLPNQEGRRGRDRMQSVSITTDVVGSTPAQGEVYNIM